ncbi:MAG: GNAT family N-acetyltransferase [Caldisericia bacterium]|nr:GNAT family N-acetyltransferase [Caldisericia bacterium]
MYSSTENMDIENRVIRLMRQSDYESVCELSKSIWEGNDYLPEIFHQWVDAPGLFLCIEDKASRQVIATAKYSYLEDGSGILEGLRVHEKYRGQNLSWHICTELFKKALEDRKNGITTQIVNCTHITNKASLHISTKIGFSIRKRFLVLELDPKIVHDKFLDIENWYPTFEEFINQPYFASTEGLLAQNFVVQRLNLTLFKALQKTAKFVKVNGCPGFYDNHHGWYNVALDPSPNSIYDWLVYANRQPNVPDSLAFITPDPALIEDVKKMPVISWVNYEPDLLYLVYASLEYPSVG